MGFCGMLYVGYKGRNSVQLEHPSIFVTLHYQNKDPLLSYFTARSFSELKHYIRISKSDGNCVL